MWLGTQTRPDNVTTKAAFRSSIIADLFYLAAEPLADREGDHIANFMIGAWQRDLDSTLYRPIRFLAFFDPANEIRTPAEQFDGRFSDVAAIIDACEIRITDRADELSAAAALNMLASVDDGDSTLGDIIRRELPLLLGDFATGTLGGSTILLVDRYVRNPASWNPTEYDASLFLKFAMAQPKAALVLANLPDRAFFPVPTADGFPSPRRERRVDAAWHLLARQFRTFPLPALPDGRFPCLAAVKKRGSIATEVSRSLDECSTPEGLSFRRGIQGRFRS